MTKQEAIDYIKEIRRTLDSSEFSFYAEEALDMAIEALEANSKVDKQTNEQSDFGCSEKPNRSEPKTAENGSLDSEMPEIKTDRTTSGDLINRQDAIDAVIKRDANCGIDSAEILKALPSAQPEQRDLEKQLHDMFDHIWDCEIDHPVYQDTVGDLMSAVIQAHYNSAQPEIIRCKDCCHYPSEYADCPMIGWARNENDFCSKAERKDND